VDTYFRWSAGRISEKLQGLEVALIGNNLLDRACLATISGQGAFIGAPRTVSLNVTTSF
jgi:outer membrane receptor for ferric coprogen and ferric-rhodotorulic acid